MYKILLPLMPMAALVAAADPAADVADKIDKAWALTKQQLGQRASTDISLFDVGSLSSCLRELREGDATVTTRPWLPLLFIYCSRENQLPPTEAVELMLAAGADPNAKVEKRSALPHAAKSPELVRMLLAAGANVQALSKGDKSLAVTKASAESLRLLLEAGIDPNEDFADDGSPLIIAVNQDEAEKCSMLLAAGADVNKVYSIYNHPTGSPRDTSALDIALSEGCVNTGRLVLQAGGKCLWPEHTPLHKALFFGEADEAMRLLEGRDINAPVDGSTPLAIAAKGKQAELCARLLKAGAKPDARLEDQPTPLTIAATAADLETCRVLLEGGADVNATQPSGFTPLHLVLIYTPSEKQCPIVSLLLAAGANPNAEAADAGAFSLPINIAFQFSSPECLQMLVDAGGDVSKVETASVISRLNYDSASPDILKKLAIVGADLNARDSAGRSLLHAVEGSSPHNLEMIRAMLAAGVDPCVRDYNGYTPLHVAIRSSNVEACRMFIEAGAGINEISKEGKHPLLEIMSNTFMDSSMFERNGGEEAAKEICNLLIDKGAKLDDEAQTGRRAFNIAVRKGWGDVCINLANHGADIHRWPALHRAAILGQHEELKRLLAAGANTETTYRHYTPLVHAARVGQTESCKILLAAGANVNAPSSAWPPLAAAAMAGHVETCRLLLAAGADIKAGNSEAGSLLHLLCQEKNDRNAVIALLLEAGCDVNATDDDLVTPLHVALHSDEKSSSLRCVRLLLDAGANPNARDSKGNTPLHYVVASSVYSYINKDNDEIRNMPLFQLLIKAGADPSIKNNLGHSVEDWINDIELRDTSHCFYYEEF